jgi:uncharacterized protein (DUF1697 family)
MPKDTYIALLRAVNVGGTGKLPMTELKAMCEALGFTHVKTYIASGNVIFKSNLKRTETQDRLEASLCLYAGKPVQVYLRTTEEMQAILLANPYLETPPNKTAVLFLNEAPDPSSLLELKGRKHEEIACGMRELYIYYADGMADTKLALPHAARGSARNINTVTKLIELAQQIASTK